MQMNAILHLNVSSHILHDGGGGHSALCSQLPLTYGGGNAFFGALQSSRCGLQC
jgi:hypothetical protein